MAAILDALCAVLGRYGLAVVDECAGDTWPAPDDPDVFPRN